MSSKQGRQAPSLSIPRLTYQSISPAWGTMGLPPHFYHLRSHEAVFFVSTGKWVPRFAEWKRLSEKFLTRPHSAWLARDGWRVI